MSVVRNDCLWIGISMDNLLKYIKEEQRQAFDTDVYDKKVEGVEGIYDMDDVSLLTPKGTGASTEPLSPVGEYVDPMDQYLIKGDGKRTTEGESPRDRPGGPASESPVAGTSHFTKDAVVHGKKDCFGRLIREFGFCYSDAAGAMEKAVGICSKFVKSKGSPVQGVFLLISINHYEMEQERVLVITEKNLHRIKFNFQTFTIEKCVDLALTTVSRLVCGPIRWGDKMAMVMTSSPGAVVGGTEQGMRGLRVVEGTGDQDWLQRWNPLAKQNYSTYTSHTSITNGRPMDNPDSPDVQSRDVIKFQECLVEAVVAAHGGGDVAGKVEITESTIKLSGSVSGRLYNDNKLGHQKERGGVSF